MRSQWQALALSLAFGAYLHFAVDLRLAFHARDKLFLLNGEFFLRFLAIPGAPLEWLDRLVLQLYAVGWGAWALSLPFFFILAAIGGWTRRHRSSILLLSGALAASLLTSLYSDYQMHTALLTGGALNLAAALGWRKLKHPSGPIRAPIFLIGFAILFALTGPLAWLFAAMAILYEGLEAKRWRLALGFLVIAVCASGAVYSWARFDPVRFDRQGVSPPFQDWLGSWKIMVFLTATPILSTVHAFAPGLRSKVDSFLHGRLRAALVLFAAIAIALGSGFLSIDRNQRRALRLEYHADRKEWGEVLRLGKMIPPAAYSPHISLAVHRALFHTGRLSSDLLEYPQSYWLPSLEESRRELPHLHAPCELFLELGRTGEALHLAHEQFEVAPTGRTMRNLALLMILRRQEPAARLVLRRLCDDLTQGDWARARLAQLDQDPGLFHDEALARIRSFMLQEDDLTQTQVLLPEGDVQLSWPAMLQSQVRHNPGNLEALEYLRSILLLTRDLEGFLTTLSSAPPPADKPLPLLFEQAIMVYSLKTGAPAERTAAGFRLFGVPISEQTLSCTRRFFQLVGPKGPTPDARAQLGDELSTTYLYYYWYGPGASP
ncbi:MAG: hypothetical protein J0L75_19225 [Spirochaetes bacterium]|nr:hypothetical protein [Spirochaetota bacterium]